MFRKKKRTSIFFFHKKDFKMLKKKFLKLKNSFKSKNLFFSMKKKRGEIFFTAKSLLFVYLSSFFFFNISFYFYLFYSDSLNLKIITKCTQFVVFRLIFFYSLYRVKKTFFTFKQKIHLDKTLLNTDFFKKKRLCVFGYKIYKKKSRNIVFTLSKKKTVQKIKLLFYKNVWIKFLSLYIINIYYKFIQKYNKYKKVYGLFEKHILVGQYLNFGIYNMKMIIHKADCPFITQVRFLAMVLITHEIKKLLHIVALLVKRYNLSSFYLKRLLTCLELIIGNGLNKNICIRFFKGQFFFLSINFKKIPTKVEKIFSYLISNKYLIDIKFTIANFFFRFGMVDLIRKIFQKITFSSAYKDYFYLLKYENLFKIYDITKKFNFMLFLLTTRCVEKNFQEFNYMLKKNLKSKNWKFFVNLVKFLVENKSNLIYKIKLKL